MMGWVVCGKEIERDFPELLIENVEIWFSCSVATWACACTGDSGVATRARISNSSTFGSSVELQNILIRLEHQLAEWRTAEVRSKKI